MRNNEEFRQLVQDKYNGLKAEKNRKLRRLTRLTSSIAVFVIILTVIIGGGIAPKLFGGTLFEAGAPAHQTASEKLNDALSDDAEFEQSIAPEKDKSEAFQPDEGDVIYGDSPAFSAPIEDSDDSFDASHKEPSEEPQEPNESKDDEESPPLEAPDESCNPETPGIPYPSNIYLTWNDFVASDGKLYGSLLNLQKHPGLFDTTLVFSNPKGFLSEWKNYAIRISGGDLKVFPLISDAEKDCTVLDFILCNHSDIETLPVFTAIEDCSLGSPYAYKYTKEGIDIYAFSDGGSAFKIYFKIGAYIFNAVSDGYALTEDGLLPTGTAYENKKFHFKGNHALYEIGDFMNDDSEAISALKELVRETEAN